MCCFACYLRDGKSRQFAFIGFRTEHEAQEAIQYFHRSYLDTCRITCEVIHLPHYYSISFKCLLLKLKDTQHDFLNTHQPKQVAQKRGDANLPRPWSRHSTSKENKVTPNVEKHAKPKGEEQGGNSEDIDDPQLQEFLQVMQPRARSKLWANDTSMVSAVGEKQTISNKESKDTSVDICANLDHSGSLVDHFPNNPEADKSHEPEHDEVISDMDYFKSRVSKEWSDSESGDDEDDNDNDSVCTDDDDKDNDSHASEDEENFDKKSSEKTQRNGAQELDLNGQPDIRGEDIAHQKSQVNSDDQGGQSSNLEDKNGVFESCRLFVRNLPYTTMYLYISSLFFLEILL